MEVLLLAAALLGAPQDTAVLTLGEAVARALAVSPLVAAADGAVRAPEGERSQALWPFPSNPAFEYGRARRRSPDSEVYDWEWRAIQEVELGGQWFLRRSAASRRVDAAQARALDARRLTVAAARAVYVALAIAERRAALTDSNAVFAERLAESAQNQLDAGEINRLEYNAAVLESARARSEAERARGAREAGAANLARLLALGPDSMPRTSPLPTLPDLSLEDEVRLLSIARARRPDLSAATFETEAAERTLSLAKRSLIPNLTFSVFSAREEGTDDLLGFTAALSIPLFQRQQANIGLARAGRAIARAEVAATTLRLEAEVRSAAARYMRAASAERRFAVDVLRAATENVTLTERALEEGEVSVTDVVVLRSAAVAAQLEYLEVLAEAYLAWFELAAGLNATPAELSELIEVES